jgi:hypothetical protein
MTAGTEMPITVFDTRAIGARSSALYGPVLVHPRMRNERRGRRQQQDVIVLGADEGVDGDDAVAAGAVLDHHRLAPFLGQPVREKPAANVSAAARAERENEFDGSRRPGLRRSRGNAEQRGQQQGEHDGERGAAHGFLQNDCCGGQ